MSKFIVVKHALVVEFRLPFDDNYYPAMQLPGEAVEYEREKDPVDRIDDMVNGISHQGVTHTLITEVAVVDG